MSSRPIAIGAAPRSTRRSRRPSICSRRRFATRTPSCRPSRPVRARSPARRRRTMRRSADSGRWFFCRRPNPRARARVFCFAHAGGSATMFRDWHAQLPAWIEVCPIELPGRWSRRAEPLPASIQQLAEHIATEVDAFWDLPVIVFGHSMGALVGFELARALRRRGIVVSQLHAAARSAPQWPRDVTVELHGLPDEAFLAGLQREYGGIP